MKIRILIIATLLYSVCAVALPQNDNYNVISTTDSKAEIEVSGNCKITVADLNGALKIYGDQNYGGTTDKLFSSKQVEPNNNIKGIRISRESKKVVLIIDYNKLTNSEITLIKAEYKDSIKAKPNKPGYFPSSNVYKISFIKSGVNEAGSTPEIPTDNIIDSQTLNNKYDIDDLNKKVIELENQISRIKKGTGENGKYSLIPFIICMFLVVALCFILFISNRNEIKKLAKDFSKVNKAIDSNRKNMQAQLPVKTMPKEKIPDTMSRQEIQKFVVEQIKFYRSQLVQQQTKEIPTYEKTKKEEIEIPKQSHVINTDQVKYHDADMPYFSLEQTQTPLFKIFTQGEDYYYTIVDDPTIREEIVGMIQGYEGCLTYQTSAGMAKRIEPVSPGKLRKDGDKFYVDANNKLVVKYV